MSESATQVPTASVPGLECSLDHILIVMFENMYRGHVLGNPHTRRGIQLGTCFGVMHPCERQAGSTP